MVKATTRLGRASGDGESGNSGGTIPELIRGISPRTTHHAREAMQL